MPVQSVKMKLAKETKGTFVYKADDELCETLYLKKEGLGHKNPPKTIDVKFSWL